MSPSDQSFTGHCLCGAITFDGVVPTEQVLAVHCHCKDCQRATGSGFATVVAVPEAQLNVHGTVAQYTVSGATGGEVSREFCSNCGSPMFTSAALSPGLRFIKAGVLDDSSWVTPVMACWTERRASWCVIDEALPCVPQNPDFTG